MNTQATSFNPGELSSRKLWQIVVQSRDPERDSCSRQAVRELAQRQRYLRELSQLGQLQEQHRAQ